MIKFIQGHIVNTETGIKKDIVVKSIAPNKLKDALIGGGLVLIGIAYLTATAFKNGSMKYEAAEYDTFVDLGLIIEDHK